MLNIGCSKIKTLKVIFDPPAAIKSLKRSGYGQLKWLTALEYSHLRASGNPEKSRDYIFENPGIGILKKSQDPGISRDPAGACPSSRKNLMPVGFVDHRSAEDQYVEEDDERVEDGERGDLSSHQQSTINIYV